MAQPTRESLVEDFRGIRTFAKANKRAPHKHLLLLQALARVQRKEPRWLPYPLAQVELGELLARYSPFGNRTPENPFWRLRNDEWRIGGKRVPLWEVRGSEELLKKAGQKSSGPSSHFLLMNQAEGAFHEVLHDYLVEHPSVVNELAQDILDRNFPTSYHEELLDAIAMPWVVESSTKARRDPKFRGAVLSAYGYACAICGYDGRLGELSLGIEAAHIRWHAMGGPDEVDNGLALCTFHHKVLDYGAIGITDERAVQVKRTVNWRSETGAQLLDLHGRPLREPTRAPKPKLTYIHWHQREVFGEA